MVKLYQRTKHKPKEIQTLIDEDDEYIIKHTKLGQVYYVPKHLNDNGIEELAANEFKKPEISIWMSDWTLGKKLGRGIYLYFDFLKHIILFNAILAVIQLAAYLYVIIDKFVTGEEFSSSFLENLWATEYLERHRWIWIASSSAVMLLSLVFGPIYVVRIFALREYWSKSRSHDDRILEHLEKKNVYLRRGISCFITLIGIILQTGIAYFITWLQNQLAGIGAEGDRVQTIIISTGSFIIGCIISVNNIIWKKIAVRLNDFEYHYTWASHSRWLVGKLIVFKISQLVALGIVKQQTNSHTCPISTYGNQYFYIIIIDLVLWNGIEIGVPIVNGFISLFKETKIYDADDDLKPKFDTGEEFLELLYRQFVLYQAMISFPLAPVITFFGFGLEYVCDRIRLIYISATPTPTVPAIKSQLALAFSLSFVSLVSIVNVGGGGVYLLLGKYIFCNDDCYSACRVLGNGTLSGNSTMTSYF